jgi:formylmethanofuran dehydrogenase subunit E
MIDKIKCTNCGDVVIKSKAEQSEEGDWFCTDCADDIKDDLRSDSEPDSSQEDT